MKIIITSFFFLLLFSCNQKVKEIQIVENEAITIDPDKHEVYNDLSNILQDSIKIIQLETTDECLIATVNRVEFKNDKIFISDYINQKIFIFNSEGKYLKSIGKSGNGPGEIRNLGDFTFVGDSLFIQDGYARKYLIYNTNGDYLGNLPYKTHHHDIVSFDNILYFVSNYFYSDLGFYNLFRYDLDTKKTNSYIPFDEKIQKNGSAWGINRQISKYKDSALLLYPLNDTIFEVSKNNVNPRYTIRFSKHNIPENIKDKDGSIIFSLAHRDGYIKGLHHLQNSKDYLLGIYTEGNSYRYITIDKKTLKYKIGKNLIIKNYGNLSLLTFYTTSNDELISILDADLFHSLWKNNYSKNIFENKKVEEKLKNTVESLSEDNNPVLFIFKFKDK